MMRLASWTAAVAVALTAGLAPAASATAAAAAPAVGLSTHAGTITNYKFRLNAVSADSSSDAWAVGNGATTLHWDGTSWAPVTLPGKSNFTDYLSAVDALSPSDVWAVGQHSAGALIMHWNGTSWTRVPSPGRSTSTLAPGLSRVSMDSATDGWATGSVYNPQTSTSKNFLLHWNGTSWQRVAENPAFAFSAVHAVSPTDATAMGGVKSGSNSWTPVVFHWNGTSWAQTATLHAPPGVSATTVGVSTLSADSATDMWATGAYQYISGAYHDKNLAWHWNGTRWTVMTVPSPGITSTGTSGLLGVAATSPANVWAVGVTQARRFQQTVSVHWDGTSWSHVATPDPGSESAVLTGVAAAGPGSVWAVGYYNTGPQDSGSHTLILHWNGSSWVRS